MEQAIGLATRPPVPLFYTGIVIMNGFGSLAILLLAGQITGNSVPRLPPQMPAAGGVAPAVVVDETRKSYGWDLDVNRDNELYYIIQISPEQAEILLNERTYSRDNPREVASDMPAELFGVVQRIVVRIGDDVLPRNPPLEEVARMQRRNLQASLDGLGSGRMADVESGAILPAGQRPLPTNPSRPGTSGGVTPPNNTPLGSNAFAGNSTNNSPFGSTTNPNSTYNPPADNAASTFLDGARGNGGGLSGGSILPPSDNDAEVSRLADANAMPGRGAPYTNQPTARGNAAADPPSMGTLPTFGASQRFGDTASNTNTLRDDNRLAGGSGNWGPASGRPSNPNATNPQYDPSRRDQYGQTPSTGNGSYAANPYDRGQVTGQLGAANQGAGQMYPDQYANRNQNTQPYQNGPYAPGAVSPGTVGPGTIGYNQYDNSQQGNGFQSNPTGQDGGPFARTASNTSLNSAAPQQQNSNLAAQTATGTDTSASDSLARAGTEQGTKNDTSSSTNKSAETQGIVTVLFLLSLVFNIYLALLIRKLLGRYRNVLMNLRTQAA